MAHLERINDSIASPGLFSFELGYIQANTAMPEPAVLSLFGLGFLGLDLIGRIGSKARQQ